jgi:hypothetical protein
MAAVRAWLDVRVVRPIRAGLSAAAAAARWVGVEIGLWVRGEWADLRRSVARVGAWLRRRPEPAPAAEPVAAEPMADPVGAAVVPFSPVEWPADVPNSEPVGTGVGDWSGDNGHNGRGRWN